MLMALSSTTRYGRKKEGTIDCREGSCTVVFCRGSRARLFGLRSYRPWERAASRHGKRRGVVPPSKEGSAAVHVALVNRGGPAVLEGVSILGARGYPSPRPVSVFFQATDDCVTSIGPTYATECGGPDIPAIGEIVPSGSNTGRADLTKDKNLVAVIAVPANGCVVIGAIVVRYRVGWRHFAATSPERFVTCGGKTPATYRAKTDALL